MLGHGHSVHLVVYHVSYHSAALVPSEQVEHGNEVWVNYNKSTYSFIHGGSGRHSTNPRAQISISQRES